MSIPVSQFITPPPHPPPLSSLGVHSFFLYFCVSISALQTGSSVNPKDATRKLLELINESGKVGGYKINAQKSLAFLYTNDEKSEREIKETLPLPLQQKE